MLCSFILVQNVCYQDFVSLSMERVFSHAAPMQYSNILTANCLMCKTLCIGQLFNQWTSTLKGRNSAVHQEIISKIKYGMKSKDDLCSGHCF